MTENQQDKLEDIIDEMLLEDPENGFETLAKWCARYPEYRDALTSFAATRAVQKALPKEQAIDETRVTGRLMSHALNIMHRQDSARETTPAAAPRLCEALKKSGIAEADFSRQCNFDETLIAKLNRRLIRAASIPQAAFKQIATAIGRDVNFVGEMLSGDPIPLGAYKSRGRPTLRVEDFLQAVESSNLSDDAKVEWVRVINAESENERT